MYKARLLLAVILAIVLLLVINGALAAGATHYSTTWQVLSAGGAPAASTSGRVSMNGTLGQTAIGASSGNHTSLWVGFWSSFKQALLDFFLPIVSHAH